MKKLSDIILSELGETKQTYDWKLTYQDEKSKVFEFRSDEHKYIVNFSVLHNFTWLYTTFDTDDDFVFRATDEGNQFKVVATVMEIAEFVWKSRNDFRNSDKIKGFSFDAKPVRQKLYKKFINHRFPNAETIGGSGEFRVRLKE